MATPEEREQELAESLDSWNALVAAIGSKTHGGAIGHAKQIILEHARFREALKNIRNMSDSVRTFNEADAALYPKKAAKPNAQYRIPTAGMACSDPDSCKEPILAGQGGRYCGRCGRVE